MIFSGFRAKLQKRVPSVVFQSILREQIRKLPKILKSVKSILFLLQYSLLFIRVLTPDLVRFGRRSRPVLRRHPAGRPQLRPLRLVVDRLRPRAAAAAGVFPGAGEKVLVAISFSPRHDSSTLRGKCRAKKGCACALRTISEYSALEIYMYLYPSLNRRVHLGDLYTESGQTLLGSFSAASKPNFASKCLLE